MSETIDITYIIVSVLTAVFFILPMVYTFYRLKTHTNFSLAKIRQLFNYTLLLQLLLGLILYLTFLVFGRDIFGNLTKTEMFQMLYMATFWFYIIGVFFYIPAVILLNLTLGIINWTRKN